jgi:hypothetical protein
LFEKSNGKDKQHFIMLLIGQKENTDRISVLLIL